MKSIQKKFIQTFLVSILSIVTIIIIIASAFITEYASESSRDLMNTECEAQAAKINYLLNTAECGVKDIYLLSEQFRPSIDEFDDMSKVKSFIDSFLPSALSIVESNEASVAVYYRLNQDIIDDAGFFYVRNRISGAFEESPITHIADYNTSDIEHVGWYYEPIKAGKAIWMEPYMNLNIQTEIISYIIPIYQGTTFVGVLGVDIDFQKLLEIASDVECYNNATSGLFSNANHLVYTINSGTNGEKISGTLYTAISKAPTSSALIKTRSNGAVQYSAYTTLQNDMKLIITVPSTDINHQRNQILIISISITLFLTAITIIYTVMVIQRTIRPIKLITDATKEYASGNWDVNLFIKSGDELEQLANSVNTMAGNTKKYIGDINAMAYKDALTGIKNKTAYLQMVNQLKEDVHANYAIAVFDVNGLKKINDSLGHEAGDKLIYSAARCVCNYFTHSPVFRIGGDEFVSIINGADLNNCDIILQEMQKEMLERSKTNDPQNVIIASGLATIGTDAEDFDSLFKIADDRMYQNKISMKNGEAPR